MCAGWLDAWTGFPSTVRLHGHPFADTDWLHRHPSADNNDPYGGRPGRPRVQAHYASTLMLLELLELVAPFVLAAPPLLSE
jgi:hypothetical protein